MEDVLKSKKTCPEESIYQLGTIDEHASAQTLVMVFDEFKKEFDERFGSNVHIIDWSLHMDEATPHIHERHVFDATNRYGEIEPKQEEALKQLGFELPQPEKARSRTNNRKMVFDSACQVMFLDICKRHGLELDEEASYGGRQYLEKQDYIRMKQKEEIAEQQETIEQQKEFKEKFISNSDRIMSQGELIEEQKQELQQLTIRIEDVETLLDEVSSEAYDKAVEQIAREAVLATRKDDIYLAEDSKKWIQSPERKASRKEKEYAVKRLDGLIRKIENAMEKAVGKIVRQLKQPEKKKAVVEEIKKEVKPSIREKLALNVAKIEREEAERKQLNKAIEFQIVSFPRLCTG